MKSANQTRQSMERDLGRLMVDVMVRLSAAPPGGVWQPQMPDGTYGEVCKVVGVMMHTEPDGCPTVPGLLMETLDGKRLYTCTHARCEPPRPAL